MWIVTYRAFESLALRLTGNNASRVLFVSGLQPDANHTISFTEANRLRTKRAYLDGRSTEHYGGASQGKGQAHPRWHTEPIDDPAVGFNGRGVADGAEMLRAGATTIVRSRTDVA